MGEIRVLSEDLINKIAAGEVIERPASVVKELIENSLDAAATQIEVEIRDSGKELIRITDNGKGMEPEDARTSILRHATSKIQSEEDLYAIKTLGFRGEALASIAAVSQLSIITKPEQKLEGFNLVVEGGSIISSGILAAKTGTTLEVRNLFFNTPARQKFLKTDPVELRHIVEIVTQYALINPKVAFKLSHEKHELLNSPACHDLRSKIASIYGTKLAKEMFEIDFAQDGIAVKGLIAKPHEARNDKSQQSIYVNGRWVKSEEVSQAVYEAYHSLLFIGKHPIFVLNLTIDPEKIDVNVHPQKTEIKFEQKKIVFDLVQAAIKTVLEQHNLMPVIDFETEQQLSFGTYNLEPEKPKKIVNKPADWEEEEDPLATLPMIEPSTQSSLEFEEEYATPEEEMLIPEQWKEEVSKEPLPSLRVLGQVHKTFFVAETPDGVVFIDQHVVQERILYERFMSQLMNRRVAVQTLLRGELVEFTPTESLIIKENYSKLESMGFQMEGFGGNTYLLKTVPTLFGRLQPKELIYELLSKLKEGKNKLEEVQEEIITRMACRASIKAGDEMTNAGMQALLDELAVCRLPYTCPHGRSVMIQLTADELEKKFRRK